MKIEDYIQSLPNSIISGDAIQLTEKSFIDIFDFIELGEEDVFYHLGCGEGDGLKIAIEKYNVKRAIGIEIDPEKACKAKKVAKNPEEVICEDVRNVEFPDATVILFWFTEEKVIDDMKKKFEKLPKGVKIITIWSPLPDCLPDKIEFPYIMSQTPFRRAQSIQEQLLSVFGVKCIDFITAWEFAERYTKAIGTPEAANDRFLTILQTVTIWINAKNLGISCGDEIPASVRTYIGILKNFFDIDAGHLLEKK